MTRTELRVIRQVTRHGGHSRDGNPRYRVLFSDGTDALTAADGAINYGISNADLIGVALDVTFRGRDVVGVQRPGVPESAIGATS